MATESKRNIIIAVDGSEYSNNAVKCYLDTIHKEDHHVIFTHIAPSYAPSLGAGAGIDAIIKDRFEAKLTNKEVSHEYLRDYGHAGEKLCQVATDRDAQLLIIGKRGLGLQETMETILGSVSNHVLAYANCPVVVCKKTDT